MDNINGAIANIKEKTFAQQNKEEGDALICNQKFNADAAYDRLKLIREVRQKWQNGINTMDRRDIPGSIVEKYETVWAAMRDLEKEEAFLVRIGE